MDTLRGQRQPLLDAESGEPSDSVAQSDAGFSLCPKLSYHERLIGALTCFLLGFLLSLGSTFRLAQVMHGNPAPFAVAYTIGNMMSIGCTTFFVGPWKQVQTMFHSKRRYSAILYLVLIVVTLALSLSHHLHHRLLWVLISLLVQFMALVWYTLSYVPYGRTIATSSCNRLLGFHPDDE